MLTDGLHPTVDVWTARGDDALTLIFTNFALPEHPIRAKQIHMTLAHCASPSGVYIQRIDADHANPKRMWQEIGSPRYLDAAQVTMLDAASACVPFAPEQEVAITAKRHFKTRISRA